MAVSKTLLRDADDERGIGVVERGGGALVLAPPSDEHGCVVERHGLDRPAVAARLPRALDIT